MSQKIVVLFKIYDNFYCYFMYVNYPILSFFIFQTSSRKRKMEIIKKFKLGKLKLDYTKLLIEKAILARKNAYVPYSKFKVGAAIITNNNKIYGGFNIECSSYSPTNCAERTALFRAVYDGHRNFKAIAVVGGKESESCPLFSYTSPCGVCRQMLREFCHPLYFKIILAKSVDDFKIFTLDELFPLSFGPENLK